MLHGNDLVFGHEIRGRQVMVSELDGIGDDDGPGFFVENVVAVVVVKHWSNVESIMAAIIPGAMGHVFVVDE